MRTRDEYDRAWAVVRGVIHAWDPHGLIEVGAPEDEWDSEIVRIVAEIPRIRSEGDAVEVISCVFTRAFQAEGFGVAECAAVGRRLYAMLAEQGLLEERS